MKRVQSCPRNTSDNEQVPRGWLHELPETQIQEEESTSFSSTEQNQSL